MPILRSSFWNENTGVCEKHFLPAVPCPQCLATNDPDITVVVSEMDRLAMDFDPELKLADLVPIGLDLSKVQVLSG